MLLAQFYLIRVLTKQEIVVDGLRRGRSAPITIGLSGDKGRGVYASADIQEGVYVTEYRYRIHS